MHYSVHCQHYWDAHYWHAHYWHAHTVSLSLSPILTFVQNNHVVIFWWLKLFSH